jgi:hypothetical protein
MLFLLSHNISKSQTDSLRINATWFMFEREAVMNQFNRFDTLLNVYRNFHGQDEFLLKAYLHRESENETNTFVDKGFYQVRMDTIFFYTDFLEENPSSYGDLAAIKIFHIDYNSVLNLIYEGYLPKSTGIWISKHERERGPCGTRSNYEYQDFSHLYGKQKKH